MIECLKCNRRTKELPSRCECGNTDIDYYIRVPDKINESQSERMKEWLESLKREGQP